MYAHLNAFARLLLPNWIYTHFIGDWNTGAFKKYSYNTGWALLTRTVSIVLSFLVTIYLIRYLGPENYGQLSYAVSFVGVFSIISSLGLDNILYRDLIKYPDQRNHYLGSAFILKLVAGTIAATLTIVTAFFLSQGDVSRMVIFMLATTFIFNAFNVIGYEFQANVQQKYPSLVSLAVVVILNILKILVILLDKGVLYIGLVLLLEAILYAALFIYIRRRYYGTLFAWRFKISVAQSLLKDSWPFIFIAAFTTIYVRIDQIMLKYLLDASAVGLYDAAVRIAEVWLFIPAIIVSSLFPAIMNARASSIQEYKRRLLILCVLLCTFAAVVAIASSLLSKPLMRLLYGPAFLASAGVFSIYVWSGIWASLDIVVRYFLIAENKRVLIFTTSLAAAVINILLNLILIPYLGIYGAAWSTFISYMLLAFPVVLILIMQEKKLGATTS